MDSQHWQQVDQLFQAVLEMEPDERSGFLDRSCLGDVTLREEVESLLNYDSHPQDLIDASAFDLVARLLTSESKKLAAGQYCGHYKILGFLGTGGMGEVYLAHDTSLGRRVALKILPLEFNVDDERTRRFQQEARAASALNHPNILTIHQIGQFEGRRFIATEYIEGRTLREMLRESALDAGKAADIATQVAGALAAAHQAGIVHRDIKPENIMIRPDGYVKVLDFGLAKLTEPESPQLDAETESQSQLDTRPGVVLGTVKYMSPEQARGLKVDGRSDIFSLGVVLYEMVEGRAPFGGATISDVIASILTGEPAPMTGAPGELQPIISRMLAKDKGDRYKSAGDVIAALKSLGPSLPLKSPEHRRSVKKGRGDTSIFRRLARVRGTGVRAAVLTAAITTGTIGAGYGAYLLLGVGGSRLFEEVRVSRITTSGRAALAAISPDGRYVAFIEKGGLWVRQLATSSNILIPEAKRISERLTFSPDGNYIYFVATMDGDTLATLYQVPVIGGAPRRIVAGLDSPVACSPQGDLLAFVRTDNKEAKVIVVNADGSGERTLLVRQGSGSFTAVTWSPDGRRLAYSTSGRDDNGFYADVVEVDVEGGEPKPLTDRRWTEISDLAWLPDASALMIVGGIRKESGVLWRVSYPGGEVRAVAADISMYSGLSLTGNGKTMVSTQSTVIQNLYVQPVDDASRPVQVTSGTATMDGWCGVAWTPDGRIVYSSHSNGKADIWSMRADGSDKRQLTYGLGSEMRGLSVDPDGRYVVFVSSKAGRPHVWRIDIDGANPKQLTNGGGEFNPFFSPDGQWVYCYDGTQPPHASKVSVDGGDLVPVPSPLSETVVRGFSPDGRMVAYWPPGPSAQERKIAIASTESGKLIRLLNLTRNLQWTPDGLGLLFVDGRGGNSNLWLQPFDGAEPRQVTAFSEGPDVIRSTIKEFAWSRDQKYIAFSRGTQTGDVVLIKSVE